MYVVAIKHLFYQQRRQLELNKKWQLQKRMEEQQWPIRESIKNQPPDHGSPRNSTSTPTKSIHLGDMQKPYDYLEQQMDIAHRWYV